MLRQKLIKTVYYHYYHHHHHHRYTHLKHANVSQKANGRREGQLPYQNNNQYSLHGLYRVSVTRNNRYGNYIRPSVCLSVCLSVCDCIIFWYCVE